MKLNKRSKRNQDVRADDPDLEPLNKSSNNQNIDVDQDEIKDRSQQRSSKKSHQSRQSNQSQQQQQDNNQDPENLSNDSFSSECEVTNQKHEEKADTWNATVNMIKGFVGIGILALPAGFAKSGWLGGSIFFIVCGGMVLYLSLQMIDAANKRKTKARSITEFSVEVLGKEKEMLVNIFLFGIQTGICVAYVLFFTTYFQESLCFFVDYDRTKTICSSRVPSLLFSLVLVSPTIFVRHMSKLKVWSMFSNGLILISMIIILISCFLKMNSSYITSDKISAIYWSDFGNAIGLFVFAFEGTTLYFEIRSSMQEPTEFKTVLNRSLGFGLILYGLIGMSGYLAFGSGVRDIILFNFPMTNPLYVFIQIFYCVAILLSYPLQMFPLVNIIEFKLLDRIVQQYKIKKQQEEQSQRNAIDGQNVSSVNQGDQDIPQQINQDNVQSEASEGNPENKVQQYNEEIKSQFYNQSILLRICSLFFIFFIAIVFKRLTVFLNLVGSVGGCFFAFILPVIVYEYSMPEAPLKKIYFHRGIMVVGVLLSFIGTISSLKAMYKSI